MISESELTKYRDSIVTLGVFFTLVTAFYFLGYWLIFRTGQATPLMLSVGLATVITCLLRKRDLADLGWQWGPWKYQWMSYFIPFFIILVASAIIWLAGLGDWHNPDFLMQKKQSYNLAGWSDGSIFLFHILLTATMSFVVSLPSVLGEEMGWRGLLVPELSKFMSFTGVALVSGLVWSVWHWPLIIKGLYGNDVTPLYYQLAVFTLFITSTGVIMAYLRMKSGSLWTAVIYHMSSNIFIQKVFTPMTAETPDSRWYIDEFGIVTALVACCVAFYFWRKGVKEFETGYAEKILK